MSNLRKKIIYDSTLANPWEIDANNKGPVTLFDANGDPMFTTANPGVIEATALDIRDLDSATDSVTVVGTDLDIRDLDAAQDNVEVVGMAPDGTNTMPSLDAQSRAGYMQVTNGTNELGVDANNNAGVVLYDSAGNVIASHSTTSGGYHFGTMMQQDVNEDTNNSSTTNLASANSYTFTGTGTSTLGVSGLQWSLKTDQNATVYVEESPDNSNWDISYSFDYIESKGGRGETVQATQAYWRIRVVLTGTTDTTYFRLSGVLCPIAVPLPSELSPDGRCKVEATLTGQQNTDRHVWTSPTNSLSVDQEVRLVGTNFDGTTKDTNFWTETVTGSGAVAQTGEIKLTTGTTANSTTEYESVRRARFVVGSALKFTGAYKFNDALVTDNIRRCGAYDDDEGFFFELDGSVLSVGSRKVTSDTLVSSGSFNGNYGSAFVVNPAVYYKLDIEWTPLGAFYYINGVLLHKSLGGHLTRKLTLPIRFENNNTNGVITDVTFDCLGVVIMREGKLETNPAFSYIAGAATTILKYGAGDLHTIVNNDNSGSLIAYDNTAGSGTIICSVDLAKVLGTLTFNAPFSDGLTIVSTGSGVKVTVTYE